MSSRWMSVGAIVGVALLLAVTIASAQQRPQPPAAAAVSREVAVFNPVDGRIRVLSCRADGDHVARGEVVCELDPAGLKEQIAVEETEVQALQSGSQGARLAREAAAMELTEYKEGRFRKELTEAEDTIKLAETDLVTAGETLDWTRRMFDKGYVSMFEKVAKELAYKKAQLALEEAQARRQELVQHARDRTTRALMAAVEASRERELSKQAALQRAEAGLKRLHDQVAACQVAAPVAGRVRYERALGPGAVVREGQVLLRIVPDDAR
ncbi:MAG: HlyD family secretion protein [Isosphaeraceae bacterium]